MVIIQTTDTKFGKIMGGLSKVEDFLCCLKEVLSEGEMDERKYEDYDDYEDDDMEHVHEMKYRMNRRGGTGKMTPGRYRR